MARSSAEPGTARITLDGQLVEYWEREAARFEDLARTTPTKWLARGYARRAARARALAEQSRAREAARRRDHPESGHARVDAGGEAGPSDRPAGGGGA